MSRTIGTDTSHKQSRTWEGPFPAAAGPRVKTNSVRCGPNEEIEAGSVGERLEIPISGEERDPAIHTALGDQGVAEARLAALCEHLRS
jgi:hypothetical protein